MGAVRRYRIRYADYGDEATGTYISKDREFRSLRSAGEFIVKLLDSSNREFLAIAAVEVEGLTEEERSALVFFTEGKLDLRRG